jgi:hypothetical protein
MIIIPLLQHSVLRVAVHFRGGSKDHLLKIKKIDQYFQSSFNAIETKAPTIENSFYH